MGERFDSLMKKGRSFFSGLGVEEKAKESLGVLQSPVFRQIPPEMRASQFLVEGMKGWAYAAISAIADDVSANPCVLYKRQGPNWVAIDNHQVLDLINKPNPYQTKEEFFWLTIAYLLTIGEAMWILDNALNPKEMVIFNPSKTLLNFDQQEMIKSYTLTLTDGKTQEVPAENVIFFKLPSFQTPFRGTGVLEHITQAVDIDNFVQDYVRIFFYNSALPNGVLQTEQELTEDIAKRMLKQFENRHKGLKNSHKLAVLEKGLKFTSIDKSFSDMQMGEMETRIRDRILSAFRVPKSILGIIDEVNRANAEASDRNFSKRAVMPKLRFLESQINQYLIPKFGDSRNLWFEFESPVMEDELTQAQVRQINILSGVRTANEYRQEDGLAPLTNDVQDNPPATAEEMKQFLRVSKSNEINRKKHLTSKQRELVSLDEAVYKEARKIVESNIVKAKVVKEVKVNKGPFMADEVETYHAKKVENNDKIEKQFTERVLIYQKRQKRDILSQLSGKRRKKASLTIEFNEEKEAEILAALSVPYYERSLLAQAALTAALLNIDNSLDTQDNRVKNFMKKWSGKLGDSNSQTTQDFITKTLREWGANEDATIADLKKTFTDYFDDKSKAEMIARSETARASGFATETVYKDAGVVAKKWAAAIDERVCEFCSELDGQIVGLGDNFVDSGDKLVGRDGGVLRAEYGPIPAEPSHPGCRCDILPVFEYDKSATFSFKQLQKKMIELDNEKRNLEIDKAVLQKDKEEHEKEVEEDLKQLGKLKSKESEV